MFTEADIKPHMEVIDTEGRHIGTVDHVEGGQIKLTRTDSTDGQHHYVEAGAIDRVEGDRLVLRDSAAKTLGTVESNMTEAEIAAASDYHATTASPLGGAANRPFFGTSGTGTGMGGSGQGEH